MGVGKFAYSLWLILSLVVGGCDGRNSQVGLFENLGRPGETEVAYIFFGVKFAIPFKEHLKPTNPNTSKYIYNNISLFFLVAFPLLVGDRCHQLIKNRYTQKGLGTLKL